MHQDEGNYKGKHPEGSTPDENVRKVLETKIKNERISCSAAHQAAAEASVSPAEIGIVLDLLEVRINGCQLGLFGHKGDKGKAELKMPENPEKLISAVLTASQDGAIGCAELWAAAAESGFSRHEAAAVCDGHKIKIGRCQLGAF